MLNCVHLLAARYAFGRDIDVYSVPAQEFEELYPRLVGELSSGSSQSLRALVRIALFLSRFNARLRRRLMERVLPSLLHFALPFFGVRWTGVVNEPSMRIRGNRLGPTSLYRLLTEDTLSSYPLIALGGGGIRDWPLALQYRDRISALIRDDNPHHVAARHFVATKRRQGCQLIGVLIRQTDYRLWEKGCYFYETREYATIMRRLAEGCDVQFIVASDEYQDLSAFAGLDVAFASGREIGSKHYMESFFELSLCDKIVSPPSSFALMAAYVGSGKLLKVPGRPIDRVGFMITDLAIEACWLDPDFGKVS